MKRYWRILFACVLLGLSGLFYLLHFIIFRDAHHIFIYLLGDIAFVPISVLMVTLVLEHILEIKQKDALMHKLNMVLGTFFSEVGNTLIKHLTALQEDNPGISEKLLIKQGWGPSDFAQTKNSLAHFSYNIQAKKIDLVSLRAFLAEKRPFLLGLLENPNLLEHDKITDMLWSIFHLAEELMARNSLLNLTEPDMEHLSLDLKRSYVKLTILWLDYMQHLKNDYPYLFSLALRMNPFDPMASAEVHA